MAASRDLFEAQLAAHARLVENYLAQLLDADGETPARLIDAMRHAVLAGGKRLRPFLVLESAALFTSADGEAAHHHALVVAAALECVHCYSLAHDDLPAMDNDDMRRGRPTVWRAFDEWTAILAGDGLLTLAFELIAALPGDAFAVQKSRIITALALAAGSRGMVGGQVLDLAAEKCSEPKSPDLDHIRRLQAMKTGALIRFACEAGVLLANAGEENRRRLVRFGEAIGFAFQITDDLLDVEGEAAVVGKATRKDQAAGKATLVSLMGENAARAMLLELQAEADSALLPFGTRADLLRATMDYIITRRH